MTIDELMAMLEMQEEILQFFSFYQRGCLGTGKYPRGRSKEEEASGGSEHPAEQWLHGISVCSRRNQPPQ